MGRAALTLVQRKRSVARYCSFCGREEGDVGVLLAGPGAVFICDICVSECVAVIAKRKLPTPATREGE